jgi:hypothetical protein
MSKWCINQVYSAFGNLAMLIDDGVDVCDIAPIKWWIFIASKSRQVTEASR